MIASCSREGRAVCQEVGALGIALHEDGLGVIRTFPIVWVKIWRRAGSQLGNSEHKVDVTSEKEYQGVTPEFRFFRGLEMGRHTID